MTHEHTMILLKRAELMLAACRVCFPDPLSSASDRPAAALGEGDALTEIALLREKNPGRKPEFTKMDAVSGGRAHSAKGGLSEPCVMRKPARGT